MQFKYKQKQIDTYKIWQDPVLFVACGFGVGAIPWMPGTFGTIMGILIYTLLMHFSWLTYLCIVILLFLIGVLICGIANERFHTKDHPAAVWDEVVGFLIVMIAVPPRWYTILLGFILFRIFDIWKPGPIRWLENHVEGGLGVMLDDVLAALLTWGILQIFLVTIQGFSQI